MLAWGRLMARMLSNKIMRSMRSAEEPILPGTKAPFDLMVDDVVAARQEYGAVDMNPSEMETGMVHRWFTIAGPDGYQITVTSSHTSGRAV